MMIFHTGLPTHDSNQKTASLLSIILICLASVLSLLLSGCQDPPLAALEKARLALKNAEYVGAKKYAEAQYREAEKSLQDGRMEVARQKGRFSPFRNYKRGDSILALAFESANKAAADAQDFHGELKSRADNAYNGLKKELASWRDALDGSLTLFNAEKHWSTADMALKMSQSLIIKDEYEEAIRAVEKGKKSLVQISQVLNEYANEEAQKIKVWRRWVNETLEDSRRNGTTGIIVDKSAHKLYLIKAGKLIHTYDCELGYNSAKQKYFAGDGATPEGKYYVTKDRHNGSKFYKALLINYPNETDKKRFAENKRKGFISRWAHIGALIEIHGDGGRKDDWTDGCVALTNGEMDHLMQYVSVGTPVTIVRRSEAWP